MQVNNKKNAIETCRPPHTEQLLNYICMKCKETVQLNNILIICPNCNGRIFRKEKTTAILRIPAK
jgi:DNA-directed RNA polymerase subunit RPC12/RpoP